jgi:hypothetical protein
MNSKANFCIEIKKTDDLWDIHLQGSTDLVIKVIATGLILSQLYLGINFSQTGGKSPPEPLPSYPTKNLPFQPEGRQDLAAPDRHNH